MLNERPMNAKQVSMELNVTEKETEKLLGDLVRIRAVDEKSGVYCVTFPIFTKEDLFLVARATRPVASELAELITNDIKDVTSLVKELSSSQQVEVDKLLFAVVGCFILDWLSLKRLEEEGLLVISKPQPGNRSYLLFAREKLDQETSARLYDRMYWGSHSDNLDRCVFTSFGDRGIRYTFPDVVWNLQAYPKSLEELFNLRPWMTGKLSSITKLLQEKLLRDVASTMFRINEEGPLSLGDVNEKAETTWFQGLIRLLEDMKYIVSENNVIRLNYPIFDEEDKKIVEQIGDLLTPALLRVVHRSYPNLEKELNNTTTRKNQIPMAEVFNETWHWTFAQTNKILVEKGLFYNPPRKSEGESSCVAWISKFGFP